MHLLWSLSLSGAVLDWLSAIGALGKSLFCCPPTGSLMWCGGIRWEFDTPLNLSAIGIHPGSPGGQATPVFSVDRPGPYTMAKGTREVFIWDGCCKGKSSCGGREVGEWENLFVSYLCLLNMTKKTSYMASHWKWLQARCQWGCHHCIVPGNFGLGSHLQTVNTDKEHDNSKLCLHSFKDRTRCAYLRIAFRKSGAVTKKACGCPTAETLYLVRCREMPSQHQEMYMLEGIGGDDLSGTLVPTPVGL